MANSSQKCATFRFTRGQNMKISTVDFTKYVKLSSHRQLRGTSERRWDVFRYRKACFSELQNTTYTEGTVLLIRQHKAIRGITRNCFTFRSEFSRHPTSGWVLIMNEHVNKSISRSIFQRATRTGNGFNTVIAGSRRARNLVCTPYLDFGGNLFCQNRSINPRKPIRSHFHSNKIF